MEAKRFTMRIQYRPIQSTTHLRPAIEDCFMTQVDNGEWVGYDEYDIAITRIRELEAEIAERRMDYGEDCKRLDARIADLEQQLAAAQERNVALQSEHLNHVNALHEKLTAMTAERDSESRWAKQYSDEANELRQQLTAAQEREAAYAEYKRKLEAIVMWLERNEPSVFARGLWDAINE